MKARAKELGLGDMRVNSAGCLDRCERGASVGVIYPEGIWYTVQTKADVDGSGDAGGGGRVARLLMPAEAIPAGE